MSTTTNLIANNTQVLDFNAYFANALAYQQPEGSAPIDLDAFAAQLPSCTGAPFVRYESAPVAVEARRRRPRGNFRARPSRVARATALHNWHPSPNSSRRRRPTPPEVVALRLAHPPPPPKV